MNYYGRPQKKSWGGGAKPPTPKNKNIDHFFGASKAQQKVLRFLRRFRPNLRVFCRKALCIMSFYLIPGGRGKCRRPPPPPPAGAHVRIIFPVRPSKTTSLTAGAHASWCTILLSFVRCCPGNFAYYWEISTSLYTWVLFGEVKSIRRCMMVICLSHGWSSRMVVL